MKRIFLISVFIFGALSICAQTPSDQIQRRLDQDSRDILRQREMERAQRSIAAPEEVVQVQPSDVSGGGCLEIEEVNLSGIKKLDIKKIQVYAQSLVSSCATKANLQEIQKHIQDRYIKKGYLAARVYFDFSMINKKRLNIIVSEGILEEIILINARTGEPENGLSGRLKKFTAFPFAEGKVLQLRHIEQGLEQMNKLSSNDAFMEVHPGAQEGGSVVMVTSGGGAENTFTLSYDNSGSASTGEYKGTASFSKDNLFSLNENIYINGSHTLWNRASENHSAAVTGSVSIPFGYWSFVNNFSWSRYLTTTDTPTTSFESSGTSASNTSSLELMLSRGQKYKLSLGAQLVLKQSKNYLEDVYLDTSSRIMSVGTAYLTGVYYGGFGSLFSKFSVNRGLNILGAPKDKDKSDGVPRAQFTSLSLYANYSKNFNALSYTLSMDSQYAFDDLFSSEQIMIGGESTVRGFRENGAYGERGVIFRQDLKLPLSAVFGESRNEYISRMLNSLYVGGFFDYGAVSPKTNGDSSALAGAGGKVSYLGKYFSGGFTYGRAVHHSDHVPDEGNVFYFNAAVNIPF